MKQHKDMHDLLYQIKELLDDYFEKYPNKTGLRNSGQKKHSKEEQFARKVKKGNVEFAGASALSKTFRVVFHEQVAPFNDKVLNGNLTRMFQKVIRRGPGPVGMRDAHLVTNKDQILGFRFHERYIFNRVCYVPVHCNSNPGRTQITLQIPGFKTKQLIVPPAGSTHFRFSLIAGLLSDLYYSETDQSYHPANSDFNGFAVHTTGPFTEIDCHAEILELSVRIPEAKNCAVITCVEILFFVQDNEMYEMKTNRALMIADVF